MKGPAVRTVLLFNAIQYCLIIYHHCYLQPLRLPEHPTLSHRQSLHANRSPSSKAMARREPEGSSDPNANEIERNTDNTLQPSPKEGTSPTPNDNVAALKEERERLKSQLEYEREWAQLQKDRAELESLQHQRSRIQDGSLNALQAYQPNTIVATDRPKSYLPKPEPPHVFKARGRSDYNQWVRDCEKYHHRSPMDFQTEGEKVDFGAQYVGEVQRTTWEIWVGSKKHRNPTWAPT